VIGTCRKKAYAGVVTELIDYVGLFLIPKKPKERTKGERKNEKNIGFGVGNAACRIKRMGVQ